MLRHWLHLLHNRLNIFSRSRPTKLDGGPRASDGRALENLGRGPSGGR